MLFQLLICSCISIFLMFLFILFCSGVINVKDSLRLCLFICCFSLSINRICNCLCSCVNVRKMMSIVFFWNFWNGDGFYVSIFGYGEICLGNCLSFWKGSCCGCGFCLIFYVWALLNYII